MLVFFFIAGPPYPFTSFDSIISTGNDVEFNNKKMGDYWNVQGAVRIVKKGFFSPPTNPYNLEYSVLFFTRRLSIFSFFSTSELSRTYTNLKIGVSYQFSFWRTLIYGNSGPQSFEVRMNDRVVYSIRATSYKWEEVTLDVFKAEKTSVKLSFKMTDISTSGVKMIDINAVSLIGTLY
jgi:hypothetical protein